MNDGTKAWKIVGGLKTDNSLKRVVWAKDTNSAHIALINADVDFVVKVDEDDLKFYRLKEADMLMPEGFVMKWERYLEVYVYNTGNSNPA